MNDDAEPEPFNVPLPAGFPLPFPPTHGDHVVWIRSEDAPGGKEHEDIMLRKVPRETAMRYRAAAGGRGMTHAQYLTALVGLHGRMRELADSGDEQLRAELEALGLTTVRV